jgi:hypothetical protein
LAKDPCGQLTTDHVFDVEGIGVLGKIGGSSQEYSAVEVVVEVAIRLRGEESGESEEERGDEIGAELASHSRVERDGRLGTILNSEGRKVVIVQKVN